MSKIQVTIELTPEEAAAIESEARFLDPQPRRGGNIEGGYVRSPLIRRVAAALPRKPRVGDVYEGNYSGDRYSVIVARERQVVLANPQGTLNVVDTAGLLDRYTRVDS